MSRERIIELLQSVNQESVKRLRARIQNDERRYLPTSIAVARMRHWKEGEWKQALGYSTFTPADHIENAEQAKHLRMIQHESIGQPHLL
jgi:F420-0:gamma-glutamyl ligase